MNRIRIFHVSSTLFSMAVPLAYKERHGIHKKSILQFSRPFFLLRFFHLIFGAEGRARQLSSKTRLHNILDRCFCCYSYSMEHTTAFFACVCSRVSFCSQLVPRQLWIHSLAL